MVFVLPAIPKQPSFKERLLGNLAEGVVGGVKNLLEGFSQGREQRQIADYFQGLQGKNPADPRYKMFAEVFSSPLSREEKMNMFKSMANMGDPYRQAQQQRLERDSLLHKYGSRIKEIDDAVKGGTYSSYEEKEQLLGLKRSLQQERDQLLAFPSLEREESYEEAPEEESVTPTRQRKIKFDPKNPKHVAVRDRLMKMHKGDRQKVGEILSRKFSL